MSELERNEKNNNVCVMRIVIIVGFNGGIKCNREDFCMKKLNCVINN